MKNKAIIYAVVFLAVVVIFTGGYYSSVLFEKINSETEESEIYKEEQTVEILETIREDSFLIHGTVESIDRFRDSVIEVSINMSENFKFSPYRFATKIFLIEKNSVLNIAQGKESEKPITVLEESVIAIDDDLFLEEGDLVVIKAKESFDFILDTDVFSIIEMWKIIE